MVRRGGRLFPASGTTIRSAELRSTSSRGRLVVRLRTESDIASATLVMSRGREATGVEMTRWGHDVANRFWEAVLTPESRQSATASPSAPSRRGRLPDTDRRLQRRRAPRPLGGRPHDPHRVRGPGMGARRGDLPDLPRPLRQRRPRNDPDGVVPWESLPTGFASRGVTSTASSSTSTTSIGWASTWCTSTRSSSRRRPTVTTRSTTAMSTTASAATKPFAVGGGGSRTGNADHPRRVLQPRPPRGFSPLPMWSRRARLLLTTTGSSSPSTCRGSVTART